MNTDTLANRCATLVLAAGALMFGCKDSAQTSPSDSTAGAPATNATGGALSSSIASGAQSSAPVTGGAPQVDASTSSGTTSTLPNGGSTSQRTTSGGASGLGGAAGSLGGASNLTHAAVAGRAGTMISTGAAGAAATGEDCANLAGDIGASCGSATVGLRPSNVLIVLDKSGSMNSAPDGLRTKWESTRLAVSALLASRSGSVDYGFLLYPYSASGTAAGCELVTGSGAIHVPVGPAALVAPRIEQLLADTAPAGGTPTAAALKTALEYYRGSDGAALRGPKYVLLVTDGGPNCNESITCLGETCTANLDRSGSCGTGIANCCDPSLPVSTGDSANILCLDDQGVLSQLQALRTNDVKTFVVGIPGTEVYASYLDAFAMAGGVPRVPSSEQPHRYYAVSTETELTTTLTSIAASLGRECNIPLEGGPFDSALLNLVVNCEILPARTAQGQNWTYDNSTNSITITPSKCGELQTRGISRIDVIRGCPVN